DVIGLQTRDSLDAFLDYVRGELDAEVEDGEATLIRFGDRVVRGLVCPIGIDAKSFRGDTDDPEVRARHEAMIDSANGRAMIVGVDRLDYSKGLQERFLGYERFLDTHPDQHEKVFLL